MLKKLTYKKISRNLAQYTTKVVTQDIVRFLFLNVVILTLHLLYVGTRYEFLNDTIPLFFTKIWGDLQLAPKNYVFLVPGSALAITTLGSALYLVVQSFYFRYSKEIITYITLVSNILLFYSTIKIVNLSGLPPSPLFTKMQLAIGGPAILAFVLTFVLAPPLIELISSKGIITHPDFHSHPGMILKHPSSRGGGLIFVLGFLLISIFFVGFNKQFNAIYISAILLATVGIIDDYQNTNMKSKLRVLENPVIRLGLLFAIVLIPVSNGVVIQSINNPFNGNIDFTVFTLTIFERQLAWLPMLITSFWMVWMLNFLSWANGVDGQYGGIVGIAFVVIAMLSLRFEAVQQPYLDIAKLAAIAAGASFGLLRYTWFPSKVMWGFGAMAAGIILASTSILSGTKIAASIMVILIPFLDAVVTVIRRILQKKNPLRGDKGHLHHLLMQRGWGIRRIAVFYWTTTALYGYIGIIAADKDLPLLIMTALGVVAIPIILLNVNNLYNAKKNTKNEEIITKT